MATASLLVLVEGALRGCELRFKGRFLGVHTRDAQVEEVGKGPQEGGWSLGCVTVAPEVSVRPLSGLGCQRQNGLLVVVVEILQGNVNTRTEDDQVAAF